MTLDFAGTTVSTVSQKTPTVSRVQNFCLGCLLCLITGLIASCGGFSSAGSNTPPTTPQASVWIFPNAATVTPRGAKQFTAAVSNISNSAVTWTASAGTISAAGFFTAPNVTTSTTVTVKAVSVADPSKTASAKVIISAADPQPPVSISISPATAIVAASGSQQFTAAVSNTGDSAVTWTASAGTISPTGLFTAPAVTITTKVSVTATSVADTSKCAIAEVAVSGTTSPPPISVSISPATAIVSASGALQFTAAVSNTGNAAVTWTASAGTISATGLFTAPSVTIATAVTVTVTSVADHSKQASATVTINPASQPSAPTILSSAAPSATTGQIYRASLIATGGEPPYKWSVASGALPQGIQLDSATGGIGGTTNSPGSFSFSAKVTDSLQQNSVRSFTLVVANGDQPNTIPSTYFGMHLINVANWPSGYVGSLGKGPATTWPYLEPAKGVFNWSRLDAYVAAAQKNGVPFFYSNDYVPTWAAANTSSCYVAAMGTTVCTSTVANIQDWDNFITTLVTRYKGKIQMYELWNEPDAEYFTGTVDQMVTLTNHMYSIVRALDPKALIAAPSAANYPWMDLYWAAGGVKTVDIVPTHSYPSPGNPVAEIICSFRTLPLKALMTKYGIQTPIWDTEGSWGVTSNLVDPDLQAAYSARHVILNWACGVQRFYWYAWDGGEPPWGLLWSRSTGLNQAGVAYENVETWLTGAAMSNSCRVNAAPIPLAPAVYHGIYTCELTRPGGYVAQTVWDTDGPSIYLAPSQFTQYRDLTGHTYALPANHEVPVGYKPILLEN